MLYWYSLNLINTRTLEETFLKFYVCVLTVFIWCPCCMFWFGVRFDVDIPLWHGISTNIFVCQQFYLMSVLCFTPVKEISHFDTHTTSGRDIYLSVICVCFDVSVLFLCEHTWMISHSDTYDPTLTHGHLRGINNSRVILVISVSSEAESHCCLKSCLFSEADSHYCWWLEHLIVPLIYNAVLKDIHVCCDTHISF